MATVKEKPTDFHCALAYPCSYANILEAKKFKKNGIEQGDAKFGGQFLMDPTPNVVDGVDMSDIARLKREVMLMFRAKAPGKKFVTRPLTMEELNTGSTVTVQIPWVDGNEFADKEKAKGKDAEYARGKVIVKAKSNFQPAMAVALSKTEVYDVKTVEQFATAPKYFYSGAILLPTFGLHWYAGIKPGDPMGVSLYLNTVVFIKHGTKLGASQRSAAETFKGYAGSISEEDPTGGAASETLDDL